MQTIEQQAINAINKLKEVYKGEKRPVSKCGMYAVADVLKYSFQQYNLFN